jgi:hypothetical protein
MRFLERDGTHEEEQFCFWENSTATHIEYKKKNFPSKKANSSCTDHQQDHQ